MLGDTLSDPYYVEAGGKIRGMGLLPMDTVFASKKTRTRVTGEFLPMTGIFAALSGVSLEGYEIHMGESVRKEGILPATKLMVAGNQPEETKTEGAFHENVCGTYVHGVFDKEEVVETLIRILGERKGIDVSSMTGIDFAAFKETQYNILAAELRKHLDMKKIYSILEEGV